MIIGMRETKEMQRKWREIEAIIFGADVDAPIMVMACLALEGPCSSTCRRHVDTKSKSRKHGSNNGAAEKAGVKRRLAIIYKWCPEKCEAA